MKLYRTRTMAAAELQGRYWRLRAGDWDRRLNVNCLYDALRREVESLTGSAAVDSVAEGDLLAPVGQQEVWAAGVM
jgi:2-dehydro-3-deoxy-D-arabinonate dehydratase